MEIEVNEPPSYRIAEITPETNDRRKHGDNEYHGRDNAVSHIDITRAFTSQLNKPADGNGYRYGDNGIKEGLQPIILVPITIIGHSKRKVVKIGTLETECQAHRQSGHRKASQTQGLQKQH